MPVKPRTIYTAGPGFIALAVRDGDWKLIVLQKSQAKQGETPANETTELYNLATDPHEANNLATMLPEKVASLRATLKEIAQADRDALPKD